MQTHNSLKVGNAGFEPATLPILKNRDAQNQLSYSY